MPLTIVKTEPVKTAPLSVVSTTPITAPAPPDARNFFQRGVDNLENYVEHPEERGAGQPNLATKFGGGVIGGSLGVLAHPIQTAKGALKVIGDPEQALSETAQSLQENPAGFVGNMVGGIGLGAGTDAAIGGLKDLGGMARTAALGDPNAAALKGLGVGPKSPKALGTIQSVEGARPFLQGAQDLTDLQGKIKPAKAEIWQPYKDALDAIGDRVVNGPDGPTTVRDLEAERLQLSAINRGLKGKVPNPESVQLAQQKGLNQAQALAKEAAVKAALDPELASTGINPTAIRKAFGQVADVGAKVSGKSTLIEPTQPSGFGKIANLSIKQPLQAPAQIASGLRDLIAGRPMYAAKPTDIGIREGFAQGGVKPDFGSVRTTGVPPPPSRLLPAPAREMPAPEYNGRVEGYWPPPVDAGTIPSRLGRLLPSSVPARDIPLSSYHDIFPNQLPQGRLLDLIRESRK